MERLAGSRALTLLRLSGILLLCSLTVSAQELRYKVFLSLSGVDHLKGALTRALEHPLRSLPDVALVNNDPQFILRVLAIETQATRRSKFHLIIAYSFTTVYQDDLAPLFDSKQLSPDAAKHVADLVKTLEQYQGSGVVTADSRGIEQACAEVIAKFDSMVLDYNRRAVREVGSKRSKLE